MITAFHHIALIVSSEEALRFYKLLGFTETLRFIRAYDTVVLMRSGSVELEIFIDANHPKREGVEPIGIRHFALQVDSLNTEIDRLKASGLEVGETGRDWRGQSYCFIRDPDGIIVELHE